MHIAEGILKPEILVAGWVLTAPVVGYALYKLDSEGIPKVALLTALFFIGSFIHIPIGPTSTHLVFNGVVAAIGGVYAFLAIGIALLFQALLFGFGGLGVLGVNTFIMAFCPVVLWFFLRKAVKRGGSRFTTGAILFIGGALPVLCSLMLLVFMLYINSTDLEYAASAILIFNIPLMVIEGLISLFMLHFILKYKPQLI